MQQCIHTCEIYVFFQDTRKRHSDKFKDETEKEIDEQKVREESGLSRTGVLFGGVIKDVKRKLPW